MFKPIDLFKLKTTHIKSFTQFWGKHLIKEKPREKTSE